MSTIKDVAKFAQVSTTTVSRVLTGNGYVSEKTKKVVLKAIEELGFKPSKGAAELARRKKHRIGVVISRRIQKLEYENGELLSNEGFYSIVHKGIKDKSQEYNIELTILILEEQRENLSVEYDGYLLMGGDITYEDVIRFRGKENKPVILVDQHIQGFAFDSIVSNGYDGARNCIGHIIKRGYTKIFHIHGPLSHYGFKERYDGYRDAMKINGLLPMTFLCDDINDNLDILLPQIIQNYGVPDCIFAGNDSIAGKLYTHLNELGYEIPNDIGIVGFDDAIFASLIKPALSTVKVFRYEMGSLAIDRIKQLLYGENIHPVKMSLHTEFIQRDSCCK